MKALSAGILAATLFGPVAGHAAAPAAPHGHVLLISVDGLHALDLADYISRHPDSALAGLARHGIQYTRARTVAPADSFPGLLALTTGGTPAVTGVYYDVTYDRRLSPPGSDCRTTGTAVVYDESVDGAGPSGIDPARLPRSPQGCTPVFPHDYLRVNTVFNVVRQAGGYTAWIDKHPVYEILNGPGGHGVDDLYTPEIGANYRGRGDARLDKITASIRRTERYDAGKARALINEIDGLRHDGKTAAPVPNLFGMNMQAVNVGEKLAGYRDPQGDPTPGLEGAIAHCDRLIGKMVAALRERHLLDATLIIVTAKHGNGPIDPRAVRHVDRRVLKAVVARAAPGAVGHITTDRAALVWLRDPARTAAVARALERRAGPLGIRRVLYGAPLALYFPSPATDSRSPDLVVIPRRGVIYAKAGDTKKAEHGGFSVADRNVALLVSGPGLARAGAMVRAPVSTTQVAPTLLAALGLRPAALQAVARQGTPVLPGAAWTDVLP